MRKNKGGFGFFYPRDIAGLCISVVIGLFYFALAGDWYFNEKDIFYQSAVFEPKTAKQSLFIGLAKPDAYILTLKSQMFSEGEAAVFFNRQPLSLMGGIKRGNEISRYWRIPAESTVTGNNEILLEIKSDPGPKAIEISVQNFIFSLIDRNLYLFEKQSSQALKRDGQKYAALFTLLIFFFWKLLSGFYSSLFEQRIVLMMNLAVFSAYLAIFFAACVYSFTSTGGVLLASSRWLFLSSAPILFFFAFLSLVAAAFFMPLLKKYGSLTFYDKFLNIVDAAKNLGFCDKSVAGAVTLLLLTGFLLSLSLENLAHLTLVSAFCVLLLVIPAKFIVSLKKA
jgi:hypothetical protein